MFSFVVNRLLFVVCRLLFDCACVDCFCVVVVCLIVVACDVWLFVFRCSLS